MQAVILAGGKGTRLRPFTRQHPKPLLPLLEVPCLVWMVQRCQRAGLTDVLISVGYLGDQIEAYLGEGHDYGVRIRYIHEESPLDTAGALAVARPYFTGEPLVVFNADILTDLDLRQLTQWHRESQATATLTLTRVENITAYGLVETDAEQRIQSFREKPTPEEAAQITTDTINAGTYVLDPAVFNTYTPGDPLSFERRVFPDILAGGEKMMAYVHGGYWRDLGTPASYYEGQIDILTGQMAAFPLAAAEQPQAGVWIHETAEVHTTAQISSPCYIGSYTKVGANAILPAGTIIGGHCWINGEVKPGVYLDGALVV